MNLKKVIIFLALTLSAIAYLIPIIQKQQQKKWTTFNLKDTEVKINTSNTTILKIKEHDKGVVLIFNQSQRNPKTITLSTDPFNFQDPQGNRKKESVSNGNELSYSLKQSEEGSGGLEATVQGELLTQKTSVYFSCNYQSENYFNPTWCLPLIRSLIVSSINSK